MVQRRARVALSVIVLFLDMADAQVGISVCACQPSEYELELNFGAPCHDNDFNGLPGIESTACFLNSDSQTDVTDFIPTLVTNIEFHEFNRFLETVQDVPLTGPFDNGESIRFSSITASNPSLNEHQLPHGIQMIFSDLNAINQQIEMNWVIMFTDDCDVYPVLQEGQTHGWTVFVCIYFSLTRTCCLSDLLQTNGCFFSLRPFCFVQTNLSAPLTAYCPTPTVVTGTPSTPTTTLVPTPSPQTVLPTIAPSSSLGAPVHCVGDILLAISFLFLAW